MAARSVLDDNKRLVTEFYELAINQQKFDDNRRRSLWRRAAYWMTTKGS